MSEENLEPESTDESLRRADGFLATVIIGGALSLGLLSLLTPNSNHILEIKSITQPKSETLIIESRAGIKETYYLFKGKYYPKDDILKMLQERYKHSADRELLNILQNYEGGK